MLKHWIKKLNNTSLVIGFLLGFLIGIATVRVISSVTGDGGYFNLMNKKNLEKALQIEFHMQALDINWRGGGHRSFTPTIVYCPSAETQRASQEAQSQERRGIAMEAKSLGILQEQDILVIAKCKWVKGSPLWQRIFGAPQEYSFGQTLCRKDGKCD